MLNKKNRISNRDVIERLSAGGKFYKDRFLMARYENAIGCPSQFAVIVSKKICKKAVRRNRLRRQVYEALRLHLPLLKIHFIALVILRPSITENKVSFQEISKSVKIFFDTIQNQ